MNKVSKWIITISSILVMLVCIALDVWYFGVVYFGKKKVVSNTFEVGLQKIESGETKYFIEVNLYDDMFEIMFNYMTDERQDTFYSHGLQFMADKNGNINFNYVEETDESYQKVINEHGWGIFREGTYQRYVYGYKDNVNTYEYSTDNTTKVSMLTTNPITKDTYFKLQLGSEDVKDMYLMKFSGYDYGYKDESNRYITRTYGSIRDWPVIQYYSSDVFYFANRLYNSVKSLPVGTNDARVWEFGDMFEYYEYNEDTKKYDQLVNLDKADLIISETKSYYSIKVNTHEGKVQTANDSLFKSVRGNYNYNVTGNIDTSDYFIGKTVLNLGINYFTFVQYEDNNYALKLRSDFIEAYDTSKYRDKIVLSILINKDLLKSQNMNFVGFTLDSGLDKFTVISCQTVETIDNELVYSEVRYD